MRKLRNEIHLTQKQLGERIGVSQVYISRIENGYVESLTIKKVILLAHALNVCPVELFEKLIRKGCDVSEKYHK